MGFRFQKGIRIFKGLMINHSKSASSCAVGRPATSVNIVGNKVTGSIDISGSGASYKR